MTEITIRTRAGIVARVSFWVRRCQHELSARVHAAGDERARQCGWEITKSTGRFGFGARTYRDPRFDDRRRQFLPPADGRVKATACAVARADHRAMRALQERKCDGG